MKRSRTHGIVFIIASLCVLTLGSVTGVTAQVDKNAKRISTRALSLPKMPAALDHVTATAVGKEVVLTYSVNNKSGGQLSSVEVAYFIVDATGHIKGGGGWEKEVNVAAGTAEDFPAILENKFEPGDRLVVALAKATGQAGTFEVGNTELVDAVKAR